MGGAYTVVELDAGHWLLSEQPDLVIEPVISHIRNSELRPKEKRSLFERTRQIGLFQILGGLRQSYPGCLLIV